MITGRDMATILGVASVLGVLYSVVVIAADFGRDAFFGGLVLAIAIGVVIASELTAGDKPRRWSLFGRRGPGSAARR
jgi:predicted lipid-binding transport protein (Tim44 family)